MNDMRNAEIFRRCFQYSIKVKLADSLEPKSDKINSSGKTNMIASVYQILDSVDIDNPRFDKFVDGLANLWVLFEEHDPSVFDPGFADMMQSLSHYDLDSAASRILEPTAQDLKVMLGVSRRLHSMVSQDKLFAVN